MTWLSKVGAVLARILGFVSGVAPLIAPSFGQQAGSVATKTVSELTQFRDIIVTAETMFQAAGQQKSGPLKLKAAAPFFGKIITQSEAFAGLKIANQDKYNQAILNITSAFADLLNTFDPNSAKTGDIQP